MDNGATSLTVLVQYTVYITLPFVELAVCLPIKQSLYLSPDLFLNVNSSPSYTGALIRFRDDVFLIHNNLTQFTVIQYDLMRYNAI